MQITDDQVKITVRISGQFFNSRQPFFLSDSSLVDGLLQVRFCSSTCAQSDLKLSKDALSGVEICTVPYVW